MSTAANTSQAPYRELYQYWPSAPGADIVFGEGNGNLPRSIIPQVAGTLVLLTNGGQTITLTSDSPALPMMLACGCISKIVASGSTAYNIVVGY